MKEYDIQYSTTLTKSQGWIKIHQAWVLCVPQKKQSSLGYILDWPFSQMYYFCTLSERRNYRKMHLHVRAWKEKNIQILVAMTIFRLLLISNITPSLDIGNIYCIVNEIMSYQICIVSKLHEFTCNRSS